MAVTITPTPPRGSYWPTGKSVKTWMTGPSSRENAFDAIRLLAASSVIFSHSFMVSNGSNEFEPVYWLSSGQSTVGGLAVGVFFIISGVFISASFVRSENLIDFMFKRAKRIIPALLTVVLISVFLLGPILTNLSLSDYFSNSETWRYLRNAVFLPNAYTLPGVFTEHPIQAVNGSLWTLKFEIICYALAAVSLSLGRYKFAVVWFGWVASFLVFRLAPLTGELTGVTYYIATTAMLFRYFGAGILIYLYSEKIILNTKAAFICLFVTIGSIFSPFFVEVSAVLLPYAIITFGFLAPSWFRDLTKHGDFSYGVYIYGWPIQQIIAPFGIGLGLHWLMNSIAATLLALCLGMLSWFVIEKPSLRLSFMNVAKTMRIV